jgi:hypothetical protein
MGNFTWPSFLYGTATHTGKGFFTREDRGNFFLRGYPADVWVLSYNEKAALWFSSKNAVEKTKAEAQGLVDAVVATEQAEWDDMSEVDRGIRLRPGPITLP